MKRRAFLGLGATSVGVGALYGTGAFSSVNAGRGVSVSATGDSDGLIGVHNVDTTDDPRFENNTTLNMKVKLTDVDSEANLTFITSESESDSEIEFSLAGGDDEEDREDKTVEIERDEGSESAEVKVNATLYDGGSSDELFEDGTKRGQIELQRDFTPSPFESIDFTGRSGSTGGRGDFEFDLTNNSSDIDVRLIGIGINATTTDATKVNPVNRSGNAALRTDDGENLISGKEIPIRSEDPLSHTRIDFDSNYVLSGGETSTFYLDRFEDDNGDSYGMQEENIRAAFYFEDNNGSDDNKEFDLCNNQDTCGEYDNSE